MSLTMRNYRTFLLNQAVKVNAGSTADIITRLTTAQLRMAFDQGIVDYRIALGYILSANNNNNKQKQKNLTVMANVKTSKTAVKVRKPKMTANQVLKTLKGMGTVQQIVALGKKGFDQKQIIEAGFNKNTVYRQYREQVAN